MSPPKWFVLLAGSVALLLWVASFVADIFVRDYDPHPIIGWAAMTVVSACFTGAAFKAAADKLGERLSRRIENAEAVDPPPGPLDKPPAGKGTKR